MKGMEKGGPLSIQMHAGSCYFLVPCCGAIVFFCQVLSTFLTLLLDVTHPVIKAQPDSYGNRVPALQVQDIANYLEICRKKHIPSGNLT